jgi:hypothetical protein
MSLVSILLGANCGVMLADSQETISGYAKKSVNKLSSKGIPAPAQVQYAIGGAADSGPYLDSFNWALEVALHKLGSPNIYEAQELIEKAALTFHKRHIWPQGNNHPRLETLIMMQPTTPNSDGRAPIPRTIHVDQTAVNIIESGNKSVGIGSYLADYLAETLNMAGGDESQLLAAAVYILKQAKRHVDGVGLNGNILLFGSDFRQDGYEQEDIEPLEQIMTEFDAVMGLTFSGMMERIGEERLVSIVGEMQSIKGRYQKAVAEMPLERKRRLNEWMERKRRLG